MLNYPNPGDDLIDSRDVEKAIDELQDELDEGTIDEDDKELLDQLIELRDEGEGFSDWRYGETLISESYFETYARDLAEDIGAVDSNASWPNNCIDWERACSDLQMDYSSVEFGDETYYVRS